MAKNPQSEENELADKLEQGIQSVAPMLPFILGAIGLLVVGSIGWGIYSSGKQKAESAAWTEYYFNLAGGDPDTYLDVAEGFPDSTMSGWAQQAAGDNYLQRGIEDLYRNRKNGEENLQLAIDTFEDVEASASSDELRSKALVGLARAYESLGDLDKAIDYYEKFAAVPGVAPQIANSANERIAFINSSAGKSFYDWFSKLDPKPDAAIELPSNLSMPPTTPDLSFGGAPSPLAPNATTSTPDSSAAYSESTSDDSTPPTDIELPNIEPAEAGSPASDVGSLELPDQSNSNDSTESDGNTETADEPSGEGK